MADRLTNAEKIAKIDFGELGKLKGESGIKTLQSYLRTLRSAYNRRVGSIVRSGLVSYAQISFERSTAATFRSVPVTELSRNQLLLQIAQYSKFFNDQTSSKAGIIRVNREQDSRIFGVDKRNRPLYSMTPTERELYWDLYDEFKNQYPEWSSQPYSEATQQSLADALFDPRYKKLTFMEKLQTAEEKLRKKVNEESVGSGPNVYSGQGNPFQ